MRITRANNIDKKIKIKILLVKMAGYSNNVDLIVWLLIILSTTEFSRLISELKKQNFEKKDK